MEAIKDKMLSSFSLGIEGVFNKIINSLDLSGVNVSQNDNFTINRLLENPDDAFLFNDTVEYLKQHKDVKNKEIYLSNNHSLTLSLE